MAQSANKGKTLKVKNLTLKLPAEMPFEMVRFFDAESGAMNIPGVLNLLLGEEQAAKVWGLGLSMTEGADLMDKITAKYNVDPGK